MAWVAYDLWIQGQLDSNAQPGAPVDFDAAGSNPICIALVDSSNAPARATDQDLADAVAGSTEVAGTNYARKVLASCDVTLSANTITVDASNPSAFSQHASGFSDARYVVMFQADSSTPASTTAASSPLICYYDLGADKNNKSGDLTLTLSTSGIFTMAVA